MTTAQPLPNSSGSQVLDLANLSSTLFGKKTKTVGTANTQPLEQLLAANQSLDYNQLLQSIMQQLTGQIPQVQAAYGRAAGARTARNSPVQVGLNQLITQAGVQGANQIAQLQQQQAQANMQGAAALANATRGTVNSEAGALPQITALLGLAQAGKQLGWFPAAAPAPAQAPASTGYGMDSWQQDWSNMNMNNAVGFDPNAWEQFLP